MNEIICQAIQEKRLLSFSYKGHNRVAEPHTHGVSTANNECLRCYQVSGGSVSGKVPDWKMMTTNKINGLSITDIHLTIHVMVIKKMIVAWTEYIANCNGCKHSANWFHVYI